MYHIRQLPDNQYQIFHLTYLPHRHTYRWLPKSPPFPYLTIAKNFLQSITAT